MTMKLFHSYDAKSRIVTGEVSVKKRVNLG